MTRRSDRFSAPVPRPHAPVFAFLAVVLALIVFAPGARGQGAQGAAPAPAAAAPPPVSAAAPAVPTLADIVAAAAKVEALRREADATLAATADWAALDHQLKDVRKQVEDAVTRVQRGDLSALRYDTLVDVDLRIRERTKSVAAATATLGSSLARIESAIERLDRETALWPDRLKAAAERQAPEEILTRARGILSEIATVREQLRKRRDEVLLGYDQGVQLLSHLDSLRAEATARREAIGRDLRRAHAAPLWDAPPPVKENRRLVQGEYELARSLLVDYVRNEGARLLFAVAAMVIAVTWLLRRSPGPVRGGAGTPAGGMGLGDALACALLVALVTLAFTAPTGPTAFYPLWWSPVPLLAAFVAQRVLRVPATATLWTLAFASGLNTFHTLAELEPGFERLLLAVQVVPLVAALLWDGRRGRLDLQFAGWHPITVRAIMLLFVILLAATGAASVLGYVGYAYMLRGVTVTAVGAALVFAVYAAVLDRAVGALLALPVMQRFRSVRLEGSAVRSFARHLVRAFAVIAWALLLVYTQNLVDPLRQATSDFIAAKISVRDVNVSAGSVLLAIGIVLATMILIRLVRFLLTVELLPRFGLRPGVPFAIGTLTSYTIGGLGIVLALAALGLDLNRVTLLAGALGVGIGFGLQNIVNNMVSGLILVLERPVNVGDQIALGELIGDVRRIGMRSSTVRTVQGAEVIVPNSDLVSKQLVNWTLSDRSRRYEIDVGVAYGTDPDRVIRILIEAAARVPEVKKTPPPVVLFVGFGASSLDFRVLAWAESVDVGLQAQNNLRLGILEALTREGIEIPFQQVDVRVRSGPLPLAATG